MKLWFWDYPEEEFFVYKDKIEAITKAPLDAYKVFLAVTLGLPFHLAIRGCITAYEFGKSHFDEDEEERLLRQKLL